jgi:lipopolysaccharide export system permease protein
VLAFRYLAKEVFMTLFALTVVLMFILVSNQLVGYLNRAASGRIPGILVMQILCLEMPNLLTLLLPLGFYVSVMLAYGRLYSENEMLVFQACGFSTARILSYTLVMATIVSMIVAAMVYINPSIAGERAKLLQTSGMKAFIQMLAPQRFQVLPKQQVLYIDKINRAHTKAEGLFLAQRNANPGPNQPWQWQVVAAHDLVFAKKGGPQDQIQMHNGRVYRMTPGSLQAQYGTFEQAYVTVPKPELQTQNDLRTLPFVNLWQEHKTNPAMDAELQWRLSIILMSLVLGVVAVPMSRVSPRSGRYAKILPAIFVFLIYTNILFVWREKLAWGAWSTHANMLYVHLGVLLFGLILIYWQKRRLS